MEKFLYSWDDILHKYLSCLTTESTETSVKKAFLFGKKTFVRSLM